MAVTHKDGAGIGDRNESLRNNINSSDKEDNDGNRIMNYLQ